HHSRIRQETNSNYASILSVWDRIFGTYRMPEGRSQLPTGLNELDDAKYQTVCGMLSTPFGTDHNPDA
ncbi:MAG: sterol desaturase family protein, partial [Planctomycetia bacterium]